MTAGDNLLDDGLKGTIVPDHFNFNGDTGFKIIFRLVHLVGAYPVTPINIAIELPEFDPSVYNDAIRGQHLLAMKALRQKFSIDEKVTHVEKGLPEEVIPDLAEHLQAGIVVLGTVGRTGLSAAFLGNTAEQVIDHLRCDLLVIKPDEYQTPVELDDEDD